MKSSFKKTIENYQNHSIWKCLPKEEKEDDRPAIELHSGSLHLKIEKKSNCLIVIFEPLRNRKSKKVAKDSNIRKHRNRLKARKSIMRIFYLFFPKKGKKLKNQLKVNLNEVVRGQGYFLSSSWPYVTFFITRINLSYVKDVRPWS